MQLEHDGHLPNTHVHAPGTATEHAAFDKVEPHIESIKQRILAELAIHDATPDEFTDEHGLLLNTVRRLFVDLWKEGKIRKTGADRKNSQGNPCEVWTLGADPDAALTREDRHDTAALSAKDDEIDQLKAEIERLKAELTKVTGWQHCETHGKVNADHAWGCPDCVRELRDEIERLKA